MTTPTTVRIDSDEDTETPALVPEAKAPKGKTSKGDSDLAQMKAELRAELRAEIFAELGITPPAITEPEAAETFDPDLTYFRCEVSPSLVVVGPNGVISFVRGLYGTADEGEMATLRLVPEVVELSGNS